MSKLTELLWYELGDGLNATDVTEASEAIKALFAETMTKAFLELENSDKDVWIYRDVLSTMLDEL